MKDYASTKEEDFLCSRACQNEKNVDYYSKTKHNLCYTYAFKLEIDVLQENSSESTPVQLSSTSSHYSDYNLRGLFQRMIVKTISATHLDRE